jgi:hypothetical protein
MKPDSFISPLERNNCHLDNVDGLDDKLFISGATSQAGGRRRKDFFDCLKDRVG